MASSPHPIDTRSLGAASSRLSFPVNERSWNAVSFLQGSSILAFSITMVGVILLALRPDLLSRLRSQYRCSAGFWYHAPRVLALCSAFMLVGPLLMVLNKEILQSLHFGFPLTLSALGLSTTAVVMRSLVAFGLCEIRPETHQSVAGKAWLSTVLPIAFAKAVTLACGNAVYLHLGIGFIQMLKALNPVIIVVVMKLCGLPLPCQLARYGVYLIIAGTLVEVKDELNATVLGISLMMTSEIMEAINLVLTQKMLQNYKFTLIESLYLIAPPSSFFLLLAAATLELPRMVREGKHLTVLQQPAYFGASCLLGLAVNFVGMAVVQATSSLTVKVLNTIRCIGVVLIGTIFYGEYCSPLEVCGYGVALAGFSLYNCAAYISVDPESKKLDIEEG